MTDDRKPGPIKLVQPLVQSGQPVMNGLRRALEHARKSEVVAVTVVALRRDGSKYLDFVVPGDYNDDMIDALESAFDTLVDLER